MEVSQRGVVTREVSDVGLKDFVIVVKDKHARYKAGDEQYDVINMFKEKLDKLGPDLNVVHEAHEKNKTYVYTTAF